MGSKKLHEKSKYLKNSVALVVEEKGENKTGWVAHVWHYTQTDWQMDRHMNGRKHALIKMR